MTADSLIEAMALPAHTRVDQRVAKKLLLENGAPTAADKRIINDGIEELIWVAALKPESIGVPSFRDATREYLEIAVLSLSLRSGAKAVRLRELVHRAIPYPLALVSTISNGMTFSMAHLRKAENDSSKIVLDGGIVGVSVTSDEVDTAFLKHLSLAGLPKENLFSLYQGWFDRITALDAARYTGSFALASSRGVTERWQISVREIARLDVEIAALRANAEKTTQLNRRVEMNLELRRLQDERLQFLAQLGKGDSE
ncbi:MAG: DUF4391 domain-containing protein [Zavarzinella sp.]